MHFSQFARRKRLEICRVGTAHQPFPREIYAVGAIKPVDNE